VDAEHIREMFAAFGPVNVRRMFSGAGVFVDGTMIALVARDVIYLKADAETVPDFEHEGLSAFSYATKGGSRTIMSYWRMPERLYDDPDELARWAQKAFAAAQRSAEKPRAKPRAKKSTVRKTGSRSAAARAGVRRPGSGPAGRTRGRSRK